MGHDELLFLSITLCTSSSFQRFRALAGSSFRAEVSTWIRIKEANRRRRLTCKAHKTSSMLFPFLRARHITGKKTVVLT